MTSTQHKVETVRRTLRRAKSVVLILDGIVNRLAELEAKDEWTDEEQSEFDRLADRARDLEILR